MWVRSLIDAGDQLAGLGVLAGPQMGRLINLNVSWLPASAILVSQRHCARSLRKAMATARDRPRSTPSPVALFPLHGRMSALHKIKID